MKRIWILLIAALCSLPVFAAGGTCPGGSNYINVYTVPDTQNTTLAAMGVTSCYYVGVTGLDSNTGADETHPFLHVPGGSAFTGSATIAAGVGVIIEGGYILHWGSGTPAQSGVLNLNHSGSSGSPVYYGVDPTWFSGGSFARPIFTGDNAIPTFGGSGTTAGSFVSSCPTASAPGSGFVELSGTYIEVDGIEFTGQCWTGGSSPHDIFLSSSSSINNAMTRTYHHGWSTNGTTDDFYAFYEANTGSTGGNHLAWNVVDGSDSSYGASTNTVNCGFSGYSGNSPCYTGGGDYEGGWDVHNNVFRHLSDITVSLSSHTFHGNYITDVNVTSQASGQHSNCNNEVGNSSGGKVYNYNNLVTEYTASECFYFAVPPGSVGYFFNNILWGNMNVPGVGTFANNCILFNLASSGSPATVNVANITVSQTGGTPVAGAGCKTQLAPVNSPLVAWNGPVNYENLHLPGLTTLSGFYNVNAGASCTAGTCPITDNGGEVYQTEAAANGQGYTTSNNYAPTSGTNATVGAGNNLTSSCSTYSPDSALCYSAVYATEASGWGGKVVALNTNSPTPRPATGAWDTGAYEYLAPGGTDGAQGVILKGIQVQ
jgi:hypothetical protein